MADDFFDSVVSVIEQARAHVGRTVDLAMCTAYFEIGRRIVEQEQGGKERAEYGRGILTELSEHLQRRFGNGFSETNLRNFRKFYLIYSISIQHTLSAELKTDAPLPIQHTLCTELETDATLPIRQAMSAKLREFPLSWSHYRVLMRIENERERRFYEIEAANQQWTVRQLQRQYGSSLYERLALSRDKAEVMRLAEEGQVFSGPRDMLKSPVVLEFLGMEEKAVYSESDLESAVISKLQAFLLEFGKGFLFEARQKRFSYDEDDFYVDLVLYNRLLQCYVLIDLKTDKLRHQDLGQMQMYVNYFDRHVKLEREKPTVGILLCREKNDSVVQLTLPENSNIYASEYKLYLPDKALLQRKLAEWVEEFEEGR